MIRRIVPVPLDGTRYIVSGVVWLAFTVASTEPAPKPALAAETT